MNSIIITDLPPFTPRANPYHEDTHHMGTDIGTNCAIMYEAHDTERAKYIIVVNKITGERKKLEFNSGSQSDIAIKVSDSHKEYSIDKHEPGGLHRY